MKKLKKLLFSLAAVASLVAGVNADYTLPQDSIYSKSQGIQLTHDGTDFYADGHLVQRCFVDQELRGRTSDEIASFTRAGGRFMITESSGEYSIRLNGRLLGSGLITYTACVAACLAAEGAACVATGGGATVLLPGALAVCEAACAWALFPLLP